MYMEYTEIFFNDDVLFLYCAISFHSLKGKKNGASFCSEIIMPALSENSVS